MITSVIVTHNSGQVLEQCLEGVAAQTVPPDDIIIVDSGSADSAYLNKLSQRKAVRVHQTTNIGFAAANNMGVSLARNKTDHLLFLNPDAFLTPTALEQCLKRFSEDPEMGVIGGRLLGFDVNRQCPSGLIDSAGIFRTWYGRWYDRGRGEPDDGRFQSAEVVPAICGAFMFCRRQALQKIEPHVFDERFFLYKEDIDLCLSLRKMGWRCLYEPRIELFHCRGWLENRKKMSRDLRLHAGRSELLLTVKHRSPFIVWAVAKYLAVRIANL